MISYIVPPPAEKIPGDMGLLYEGALQYFAKRLFYMRRLLNIKVFSHIILFMDPYTGSDRTRSERCDE